MPKSPNQKLKILYLLDILRQKTDPEHFLDAQELIEELARHGVVAERKSLYDDIECLRLYGADIVLVRNKGYFLAQQDFELPELKLLVDAVQSSRFITRKKSAELIKKLEGLANIYDSKKLQRQVYVANRVKTMNESIYYSVDGIHTAISNDQQIEFRYFDWDENKNRKLRHNGKTYRISPWALAWNSENYYLVGYDSEEEKIKHFRVDKMLNITLTEHKRDGRELFRNFDIASYSSKMFSMYDGQEQTVTLSCANRTAGIIIDRFGQDVTFFRENEERFRVNVKVAVSSFFLTWLMNFGRDIEIVSPDSVRREMIDFVRKTGEIYKANDINF